MIKKTATPPKLSPEDKLKITKPTSQEGIPSRNPIPKLPSEPISSKKPSAYFSGSPSSVIAKMQKAMQSLAAAVMQDANSESIFRVQQDAKATPGEQESIDSRKSFSDFIAEQYIGTLKPEQRGVEWSTKPNVNEYNSKIKGQSNIYELNVVMDTLKRIGMPKSEALPDGDWEFRTHNALKNIMGFAYAMLQLEGDFGFTNNFFNNSDLQSFQRLISNITYNDRGVLVYNTVEQPIVPPNVKTEKATQLIPIIENIKKMYQKFRMDIIGNPNYRYIIDGKRVFEKYNKEGTSPTSLTTSEKGALSTSLKGAIVKGVQYPVKIDDQRSTMRTIPLSALTSKDNFIAWMKHYGLNEPAAIRVFNDFIKPQIESL